MNRLSTRRWGAAAAILGLLVAGTAGAGVYKWRDAQGNLHFSDSPQADQVAGAKEQVKQVELHDTYGDVGVTNKIPIRNSHSDGGPAIGFSTFALRLDASNSRNVTVGRAFYGKGCQQSTDLLWNDGMLDLKGRVAEVAVADRFKQAGYRLGYGDSSEALSQYSLDAEMVKLKFDTCLNSAGGGTGSRVYVKLRWSLHRSGASEAVYHGTSEGNYDAWSVSDDRSLIKAIGKAADNLLGDKAFADSLSGSSAYTPPPEPASLEAVPVSYGRGNGGGSFHDRSEQLLAESATIETSRGHGSGVVIDASGFVITNAHVVGQESTVTVLVGGKSTTGTVVKRDVGVDVALVRLAQDGLSAATVAKNAPRPGDPLYVVGTPLSLKLSHTVTQGILSAVRDEGGRHLYQTDAAINPGNSGGPVFDASGDLVALSVAALVSAQGNSLNVNYLIPIDDALRALGVTEH